MRERANRAALRPAVWRWLRRVLPYAVFVAALLLVPAVFTRVAPYTMADGVQLVILALAGLGMVPLTGYAGQVSLGQAAFYGIGAYSSAVLTVQLDGNPWLGFVLGAVLAGLFAYLVGLVLFRVGGHYLALATIAIGLVLGVVVKQLGLTGGEQGLVGVPSLTVFGVRFADDVNFYYLAMAVLLVATVLVGVLCRSAFARGLLAVGDSPVAAAAAGIEPAVAKRAVFALSAVLAALAGSLYAHWSGYVNDSTMGLTLSIQLLIVVTVGGRRSVFGPFVGAFVVVSLVRFSNDWLPGVSQHAGGQLELIAYGLALVLVLRLLPRGLAGGVGGALGRLLPARASRSVVAGRPPG
jgi:branched-chain amino acid transport system permease protein